MSELLLSMITDEMTQSLEEAIAFAGEHGMQGVELRSVEDTTIGNIPNEKLKVYKKMLDEAGLRVVSLASPLCKCVLTDECIPVEMERLERLLDACDILGAPSIRAFAFVTEGEKPSPEKLAQVLRPFAEKAWQRGKKLCFEADPSVNTTNHSQLSHLLDLIDHPGAGAIFDPGNDIWDCENEVPYPDGFEAIKKHVCHVHVKDAVKTPEHIDAVCPGTGTVDYPGLMKALKDMKYSGYFSMEPHYRVAAQLSEEMLQRPGGDAFSVGGYQAMVESTEAFKKLYAEA